MSLITIVIVLIVVGLVLWLINTYIPMDRKIRSIINIVVTIFTIIWLLQTFGILGSIHNLNIK